MSKVYLYARRTGRDGTFVVEIPAKDAVGVMKEHRKTGYQLGILGGRDYASVKRVYGEFAPYTKVNRVDELFDRMK